MELSCYFTDSIVHFRASITGQIAMQDVEVPEENLMPNAQGLQVGVSFFLRGYSFLSLTIKLRA